MGKRNVDATKRDGDGGPRLTGIRVRLSIAALFNKGSPAQSAIFSN
jgi:hypothetical protein